MGEQWASYRRYRIEFLWRAMLSHLLDDLASWEAFYRIVNKITL
jgi:hypothetical protein